MKHSFRADNQSQTVSSVIEAELASCSCSLTKSIDFMSTLTSLIVDWASLKTLTKSHSQKISAVYMPVFKYGLTYHGAVLGLFINKVGSHLLCPWIVFLKSWRKTLFITVIMWQQSETWGLPVHSSRCLGFTAKLYLCVLVLLNKLCVFVHMLSLISPDYEIQRQIDVLQRGGTVQNETRAYDSKSG